MDNMLDFSVLDRCLQNFERRMDPEDPQRPLAKRVAEMEQHYGDLKRDLPSPDRMEEAAKQALDDRRKLSGSQRRHLAYGLTQPLDILDGHPIMEEATLIGPLLRQWRDEVDANELASSHARGLFYSYTKVPSGEVQQSLRGILKSAWEQSMALDKMPPWLQRLKGHDVLLSETPCTPYMDDLRAHDTTRLEDLKARLDIAPTSWFWETLKHKLFSQIANSEETSFLESIPWFLDHQDLIPQSSDKLLKAMLERYLRVKGRPLHHSLLECSLKQWKTPQLENNRSGWNDCVPEVRKMVRAWLAEDDLRDFFDLLSAYSGSGADQRRLDFWLHFKHQIGYTKIVLGKRMQKSADPDVKKFINKQGDRRASLKGEAQQNALFMDIAGHRFIEFTKTGGATRAWVSIKECDDTCREYVMDELRKLGNQLIHQHNNWESRFLKQLAKQGIHPDKLDTPVP